MNDLVKSVINFETFIGDYNTIVSISENGPCKTFSYQRLKGMGNQGACVNFEIF